VRRHRDYSRWLTGRLPGEPPPTLFEYLPDNALSSPTKAMSRFRQIGAMYKRLQAEGDPGEYGSACPPASNRPLRFEMGRDAPADRACIGSRDRPVGNGNWMRSPARWRQGSND